MNDYVVLLRGINVGGKNKLPMLELRSCLEELGFQNVTTYIASGNVLLRSNMSVEKTKSIIEKLLPTKFKLDSELIKVLVLTKDRLKEVIDNKPEDFGDQPGKYHSDIIFMMDFDTLEAMKAFKPREGVDAVWAGSNVIYSQQLSAQRTKSRLGIIVGTPAYKSMTIRSWNTTIKLYQLLSNR